MSHHTQQQVYIHRDYRAPVIFHKKNDPFQRRKNIKSTTI